jgi:hypothetical protein
VVHTIYIREKEMKAILLALLFLGCYNMPKDHDPMVNYRMDIKMTVNNKTAVGMMVSTKADSYNIKAILKGNADYFSLQTCHRHIPMEEAGGFWNGKEVEFTYTPTYELEINEACPLRLVGIEEDKARHSWGFIDFESPKRDLVAIVKCNGTTSSHKGVSVCQSKLNLIQEIVFENRVIAVVQSGCPKPESKDLKTYRYKVGDGYCVYAFEEYDSTKKHRHTSYGYTQQLIRGGK